MPEQVTVEQFAVRYANRFKDDAEVTLGNYDALMDTTDIVREVRRQGHEPVVLRRTVTRTYTDWEAL